MPAGGASSRYRGSRPCSNSWVAPSRSVRRSQGPANDQGCGQALQTARGRDPLHLERRFSARMTVPDPKSTRGPPQRRYPIRRAHDSPHCGLALRKLSMSPMKPSTSVEYQRSPFPERASHDQESVGSHVMKASSVSSMALDTGGSWAPPFVVKARSLGSDEEAKRDRPASIVALWVAGRGDRVQERRRGVEDPVRAQFVAPAHTLGRPPASCDRRTLRLGATQLFEHGRDPLLLEEAPPPSAPRLVPSSPQAAHTTAAPHPVSLQAPPARSKLPPPPNQPSRRAYSAKRARRPPAPIHPGSRPTDPSARPRPARHPALATARAKHETLRMRTVPWAGRRP